MFSINRFTISFLIILLLQINGRNALDTPDIQNKVIACYLDGMSTNRPGRGNFEIENIDPTLCTEIIYGFADLNVTHDGTITLDPQMDLTKKDGRSGYQKVVDLKLRYPHLKILIAVGRFRPGNFSKMVKDPVKRKIFVESAVDFLRYHKFDGLDLVWTFGKSDKMYFPMLVKELRSMFNKYNFLLTAVFSPIKTTIDAAYDVQKLSSSLHYIHINSVDYHGRWEQKTGPNAPLKSSDDLNVEFTVNYLIKLGAPPSKLILGISFTGRTFILANPSDLLNSTDGKLGLPAIGAGFRGQYTTTAGLVAYNEICLLLQNASSGFRSYWDDKSCTPFAVSGSKVISYDDEKSISKKVKFAIKHNLGGVMVWSIDTDDFRGDCGTVTYPLLRHINNVFEIILDFIKDEEALQNQTTRKNENGDGRGEKIVANVFICLFAYLGLYIILS